MEPCEQCRIGRMRPEQLAYLEWVDGQMLVLPQMPATLCDVCGYTEYDSWFMRHLRRLIDPRPGRNGPGRHPDHWPERKPHWQQL